MSCGYNCEYSCEECDVPDKVIEFIKGYNQALEDLKSKIDDEYCDGGYGDYHEVEMIVRMIEELKK